MNDPVKKLAALAVKAEHRRSGVDSLFEEDGGGRMLGLVTPQATLVRKTALEVDETVKCPNCGAMVQPVLKEGTAYCPKCGEEMRAPSGNEAKESILTEAPDIGM